MGDEGQQCTQRHERESELRALAVRAWTLLDAAAKADIAGVPLHPGAWHSEAATWQARYRAFLEAEEATR
jgi:hypothetical protein